MLSEQLQYQGKAGLLRLNFQNSTYLSKYWEVQIRLVIAQTVT